MNFIKHITIRNIYVSMKPGEELECKKLQAYQSSNPIFTQI